MRTVNDFIKNLKLDKHDESVIFQHVQTCYRTESGPGLNERCTDHVRKYMKKHPPADLSWRAAIKLEDELNSGFTSKQAFKMGIPAIGIVAVLVANVTFIAWATPPGGPTPYWAGCDYPMFTSFLIVNGIAFMLAVASVIVVTAFPLILKRTPHQAANFGGGLLLLSMIAFIAAFLLAGFVTVNYKAPNPGCASLKCDDGGIACVTAIYAYQSTGLYVLDPNVAALNNLVPLGNGTAICMQYNASVQANATITTLFPAKPECPSTNNSSSTTDFLECSDVCKLLEDSNTQQQVFCTNLAGFPENLPTTDYTNLTIPISTAELLPYTSLTEFYEADPVSNWITDLFVTSGVQSNSLQPYSGFTYRCNSRGNSTKVKFNTLCDVTQGLSVTKTGEYMTEATASLSGATVFSADIVSTQVATAVEALSGFFALVLVIIIIYLIRSKMKY